MRISRRFSTAFLTFAALAGVANATEPSRLPGRLLVEAGRGQPFVSHAIDLQTGRSQQLPRSPQAESQAGADTWQAGRAGGTLVRKDPLGNLAFINGRSLKEEGGIPLAPFRDAGLDPEFRSAIPSPDGQMLLGYWQPNDDGKPLLYVISRAMKLIDSGSPLNYPTDHAIHALDWLPDGRYVYLAGNRLVIARPGQGIVSQTSLALPEGLDAEGALIKASPDGKRLLLSLQVPGKPALFLVFTLNLDGSEVRLLVHPSERTLKDDVRLSLQSPTWSPDGQWIAFVVRTVNPGTYGFYEICQPVLFVPSYDGPHEIDGTLAAGKYAVTLPGDRERLKTCDNINWLP